MASLTYPCGTSYVGDVDANNMPCGEGQLCLPNGIVCSGEFVDGEAHGVAVQRMPNGDVYVGEFRRGRRYGAGSYTFACGLQITGQWADGVYVAKIAQ